MCNQNLVLISDIQKKWNISASLENFINFEAFAKKNVTWEINWNSKIQKFKFGYCPWTNWLPFGWKSKIWPKSWSLVEIMNSDQILNLSHLEIWLKFSHLANVIIFANRSLVLYLEVLTMKPNKTSTSGNKLLLGCINF